MEPIYTCNLCVSPSRCDSTGRLGIPDAFQLFMDAATSHANLLGVGRADFDPQQLFWVTVRTKVRFFRRPEMNEEITLSTWPELPERFRCNRQYLLRKGNETLAAARTQWAILNLATGALHPVKDVFPSLPEPSELALSEPFLRMKEPPPCEPFASYRVRSTDIDIGGHMNNCAYLRAFASLFSCEDWKARNYTEFDVHYKASCYENDLLLFRETPLEDGGTQFTASLEDGKTILQLACK